MSGQAINVGRITRIPSLREIGFNSCSHPSVATLHDGAQLCLHCRAIDGTGGSVDSFRFILPGGSFFQPLGQKDVPGAYVITIEDWNESAMELGIL